MEKEHRVMKMTTLATVVRDGGNRHLTEVRRVSIMRKRFQAESSVCKGPVVELSRPALATVRRASGGEVIMVRVRRCLGCIGP